MSSAAFQKLWLDTDAWIGKLEPVQVRRLRALCEKFYEAGKQRAVPEGQQLVPVECTEKMVLTGLRLINQDVGMSGIWQAMLAAAPK